MDRSPFARARRFLRFHPLAQWAAIVSSVLTAVVFFALVLTLSLFVDLVVNRGEVPSYLQLSEAEKTAFHADSAMPEDADSAQAVQKRAHDTLTELRIADTELKGWLGGEAVERLPYRERALLWYVFTAHYIQDTVGDAPSRHLLAQLNANIDARRLDAALAMPVGDVGMLSLVVRLRGTAAGAIVASVASVANWTCANGNVAYLIGLLVTAFALAALRFGLMFLSNYTAAIAALAATARLRRAIYHHTNRLGTLTSLTLGHGEAANVLRNVETIRDALYRWLTTFFRELVKAGLLIFFALVVSFWLGLAFLLFATLIALASGQFTTRLRRRRRAAQAQAGAQLSLLEESLSLSRLVKGYLMEAFNQARVERQLQAGSDAELTRYRGEALYRPLFALLGLAAAIVLLLALGLLVLQGQLGVAGGAVLATALVCLYWPARALREMQHAHKRGRDAAHAVFAFLDKKGGLTQPIDAEFLPGLSDAVEFDKVSVQDPATGRKLLRSVSLRIDAGQRVAIVGPDAMEKYAFAHLLPRFLDPHSGEVRIDGKNLRMLTVDSLRAQIGMVMQHDLVFNDTVVNNIGCGDPAYSLHRIVDAAKIAHAHQFILKLPQGYETPIGDKGHALNPGELFRIALARAILRDPAIFVIEEPATPLDDDTKALIDDTLQRALPKRTAVFLPRRLSTIRACDQVILLYHGRIAAIGEHRDLLANNDLYKHLQYMQFNEFNNGKPRAPTPSATPVAEDAHS